MHLDTLAHAEFGVGNWVEAVDAWTQVDRTVAVAATCVEDQRLLEEAEQSVALLTGTDDQGNPETIPFDATATLFTTPKDKRTQAYITGRFG